MEQVIEMVSKYGVSFVIVGLFLYDWLTTRKNMKETLDQNNTCLKEIQNTNKFFLQYMIGDVNRVQMVY